MTVGRLLTALIVAPILFLSNCLSASAIMGDDTPHKGLTGGYAPAKVTQDVESAADFAVREQAKREVAPLKLTNIVKAEKQIVAGMNYRFILMVERRGSLREAKAIVFRNLNSRYSLTAWERL